MPEIEATTSAQIQSFLDSNGGIAVVDCHATWCGPCVRIAPFVHKKGQQTGIPIIKVDVDQAAQVSGKYGIQAMPTFLVIKSKWDNVVHRKTGGSEAVVNEMFTFATQHK